MASREEFRKLLGQFAYYSSRSNAFFHQAKRARDMWAELTQEQRDKCVSEDMKAAIWAAGYEAGRAPDMTPAHVDGSSPDDWQGEEARERYFSSGLR